MAQTQAEYGAIAGRVSEPSGRPLAGATVMIAGDSPSHHDIAALTTADGGFRFADLVPGDYTILVNAEGFPLQQRRVAVAAGETTRLEVTLGT